MTKFPSDPPVQRDTETRIVDASGKPYRREYGFRISRVSEPVSRGAHNPESGVQLADPQSSSAVTLAGELR